MRTDASSSSADASGTVGIARTSFAQAGLDLATEGLNRGFADYVVTMRWTVDALARRMKAESVDPLESFVYRAGEDVVGVCMMARRQRQSRVAAFCVSPGFRKTGVGRHMIADALAAARSRGDERMSLEVIEQNDAAVAFYRAVGFSAQRRLYGYRRPPGARAAAPLHDLAIRALADIAERNEPADVQWQLAAATLRALRAPARAFVLADQAYALVSGEREDAFDLRALVVPASKRRAGWGRRMVDALAARYPGKACNVAPIVPANLQQFFTAVGFAVQDITQLEMAVTLARR
jgi:ribosomal protein S18 acetylase RimI-like enzyme